MSRYRFALQTLVTLLVIPRMLRAQPAFTVLELPPSGTSAIAHGVSGDGSAVTGGCGLRDVVGSRAFRWTKQEGMQELGVLPEGFDSYGTAISRDGLTVVGDSPPMQSNRAFRWTSAGGMSGIGLLPGGTFSSARGVSEDGAVVCGSADNSQGKYRAFRWTSTEGMRDLGTLSGGNFSLGNGVNQDGSVIVGRATSANGNRAFRWTNAGMQDLGVAPGDRESSAQAVSADGLVVTGNSGEPEAYRPFRWTPDHGMQGIGIPPSFPYYSPMATSAHGTVIVGSSDYPDTTYQRAFMWSGAMGAVDLKDYLESLGLDLSGWVLKEATGVSYDGSAVAGWGYKDNGGSRAFLATGLFKKSDYNHDGFVDGIDYDQFFNDYETADPNVQIRADVNFDWNVDEADIDQFLADFQAGR